MVFMALRDKAMGQSTRYALMLSSAAVRTGGILLAFSACGAQAQQLGDQQNYSIDLSTPFQNHPPTEIDKEKPGSPATSSVGVVGQRQDQNQVVANIRPTARLDTRIANRVQSRIRNRIDRFYDPQANAISPFKVAADRVDAASPN